MAETKQKLTKEQKQEKALQRQKEREQNKPPQDPNKFYCTNKDLMAEIIKWKKDLEKAQDEVEEKLRKSNPNVSQDEIDKVRRAIEDDPNKVRISEKLGEMIVHIATKLTNHSKFRNYSYDLKQEMISFACFKCIQGLKNFNLAFSNAFAYLTQACWNAFINTLAKHYRQINLRKELIKQQLAQLECAEGINSSKIINSFLKDYLGMSEEE